MASITKLSRLFRAVAARDWATTTDLARAIAADEERIGHHSAAQSLRGSLNPNGRHDKGWDWAPVVNQPSLLTSALAEIDRGFRLEEVVLCPQARSDLHDILQEYRKRDLLRKHSLSHRGKLMFHGPPGCGKSMAARALGGELSLPTYVVRFDAVIGAYLGQTAIHLRELFRYAERTPCVLVFDEIDALGKKRGSPLDVGELDRIVISMMQELEHCQARGLIVATTNLAVNLDIALWRRFDLCLEFPRPSRAQLRSYVSRLAARSRFRLPREVRKTAVSARSFADAEKIVQGAVRRKVLQGG